MKTVLHLFFFYIVHGGVVRAAEVLRPRGVPLSKASFYDPTRDFTCLDGSATIPFNYINDDYCDCQDGSDEPGTPACPNGFFNCPNPGHKPLNIPSSRVNDGICDCCDASDEYASDNNCVDTCRELGRAAREEAAKQRQDRSQGYELKKAMIEEGRKKRKEAELREKWAKQTGKKKSSTKEENKGKKPFSKAKREVREKRLLKGLDRKIRSRSSSQKKFKNRRAMDLQARKKASELRQKMRSGKIEELKKEKEQAEGVKSEKEELKRIAEEPEKVALEKYTAIEAERKAQKEAEEKARDEVEAQEAFAHLDNDGDGILTLAELQSRQTFDTNRDGEVSEEEVKFYMKDADSMDLNTFITSGWLMIRPVYQLDRRMFIPPTAAPSEEGLEPPPVEFDDRDAEVPEEDDEKELEQLDPELDPEDEEEEEEEEELEDDMDEPEDISEDQSDEEEEEPKYDEETQKLVDVANAARGDFDEADRQVRDLARELRSLEESQEKDYGAEDEFRVLEGNCYEYTDREYTYRLCPFDKAIQKPKNGHGETRLGQWGEWSGPENDRYSRMMYGNGQACWNGPTRSADVRLHCGTETKLISVTEPNRCEYMFILTTPAVCSKPDDVNVDEGFEHSHIEL